MNAATRTERPVQPHRPLANRGVLALLRSPLHRLLDPGLRELRYRARRSGRTVALPVMYAQSGDRFVVLVGNAPSKVWWRHFTTPAPVEVRRGHRVRQGIGRVVRPGEDGYAEAVRVYAARHQLVPQSDEQMIIIDTTPPA
jgi:hypothetical protein